MHHLAQLNRARLRAPLDDPRTEGFTSQIEAINALAEAAPGFVWRLKDDQDYSTSSLFEPNVIFTMSVWESLEALQAFVYRGDHGKAFRQRAEWFESRPGEPNVVLWWVKAGELPTIEQAVERMKSLEANGPTEKAFTFSKPFPAPGV